MLVILICQAIILSYSVDPETGKKIRGQKCEVRDYDQFVFDIYAKYIPQPVEIKTQDSVYDHYDILEEIGTGAFGVVSKIPFSDNVKTKSSTFTTMTRKGTLL